MQIIRLTLLALVLTISNNVRAEASLESESIEFFHDYLKGYNQYLMGQDSKDAMKEIASHFHYPMMQIPNNGAPTPVSEKEQLINNFTFFINSLKQQGISRIVWEKLNVKPLTENKAMAINVANAIDKDGKVLLRLSTLYLLYKTNTGWKISVIHPHALENHIHL